MTEAELNQLQQDGKVETVLKNQVEPDPVGIPPSSSDEYQPVLETMRKPRVYLPAMPTFIPKSFAEAIQFVDDGTKRPVFFINGEWTDLNVPDPFSLFGQFIDIVHWNSIDGFTQGGTGGSVNTNDGVVTISSNTTINSTQYINSKDNYHNICEAGKLLTVEWQLSDLSHVDTYEIYLYFTNSTVFTPSLTSHHFGFTLLGSGVGFFATVGDGTTETNVDITSFISGGFLAAAFQRTRLKAVCNRGTDVKFYVNDVLAATITTNLPNTDSLGLNMGIKTLSGVQRYFSLNRILIQKEY